MRTLLTAIALSVLVGCMPTDLPFEEPETSCEKLEEERYIVSSKADARDLSLRSYCIANTLRIEGDFEDLSALEGLRSVGTLEIENNQNLRSLGGLSRVLVEKGIRIVDNPSLKGVRKTEIEFKRDLAGAVIIEGNESLETLNAFETVETIELGLSYRRNGGLRDLRAFSTVRTIGGDLDISDNRSLEQIQGFDDLFSTGKLNISKNNALTITNGFSINYSTVNGDLNILDNLLLNDAFDLSQNVDSVLGAIFIAGNTGLSECRARDFESVPEAGAEVIESNGATFEPCY